MIDQTLTFILIHLVRVKVIISISPSSSLVSVETFLLRETIFFHTKVNEIIVKKKMHLKHLVYSTLIISLYWMLSISPTQVEGSKILAVYTFPGKSHFMMHRTLIKELIQRGHHVTMITAFSLKDLKLGANYTEVLIEPVYDFWNDVIPFFKADNIFALTEMDFLDFLKMVDIIGLRTTEHALKQPKVQEIINHPQPKGQYDLLLAEQFYQEPFLALSYIYDIPVVTSSTLGYENHMSQMMGVLTPWSFVPHGFMPLTDHMSFMERVKNTYYSLAEDLIREFDLFPKMDKLVHKYFGHLKVKIPPVSHMEKNISVMLLNSHTPITSTRPTIAGMVPVGGMHIYPPKQLPQDIKNFLNGAENGVIYFSLGSNVQSKDMPAKKLQVFLEVFASMKERILWKFENESIANLPSNVMIKAWLPQADILAHPNVKVFITHGGLFGTQEGVHYAIPMLGIPIYCDQHLNMRKAVQHGYAISLDFPELTKSILKDSLEKLLHDPYYRNNIKRISKIFHDRPLGARETAMYWIEYVIRHNGATHLRSAGLDLKWYQFYLLDVIAFVIGCIVLILTLSWLALRMILYRKPHQHPKHLICSIFTTCLLWMLCTSPAQVESSKILAVYIFPGKSHFMMHNTIIKELIQRGHQVTMITAFSLKDLKLGANYTEVLIEPVYDFWTDIIPFFKADNIFELSEMDFFDFLKMLEIIGMKTTEHALKQPKVQEIINHPQPKGQYDLLLAEQFYQEPFLALSYIYDIPVVTSSTLGYENHMSQMMGVLTPWSFVPHGFLPFTDQMSFMERVKNSYYSLAEDLIREWDLFPKMDKLVQKYFGHLKVNIPPVSHMEKNVSVMLLNSHTPLTTSRPSITGMVPIGGMHIYPPKQLPQDIKTFLDGAENGAIYFSLAISCVQSKDMPAEKLKIFLEVFASMKQRILWKFENESIANLPSNVMIKAWLPQADILAHPNVKVFITHGGLFGTQEGVHYAVPMLGMPIYCDQHLNMRKAVQNGYAISLHFPDITKPILKDSLDKLLHDPYYRNNINRISNIFHDRPLGARETAMYWIEYVIRHNGASHIRSAGIDLKWYQFYLLDVIAFVIGCIVLTLTLSWLALRMILYRKPHHVKSKMQ
ncbi:UDP-glucuronosyltransferase 2B18 [Lucilia cuprina]|nr:UDP-glucuronosyltransferase 2B18 [Lucilia cuprina]